jgi:hypothetical protein
VRHVPLTGAMHETGWFMPQVFIHYSLIRECKS